MSDHDNDGGGSGGEGGSELDDGEADEAAAAARGGDELEPHGEEDSEDDAEVLRTLCETVNRAPAHSPC